ncbi:MAG: hypothetical protein EO766_04310 [Hydrotalea sp. AMD]|uniref:hypothetical protein n=1 Tax=Hydrotalea sp. AMD TaxID=2501297 RepID=UPI000944D203|nr:hypothetical protein [Hydrotalea sp. AMD]RWZ89428.1 MAG: hypothetical protein EO766_04310 [Hydrotalea sp. AMD]
MKKVFIIASMACIILSACSNNTNKESDASTQNEQETMGADSNNMSVTDTTQAAADKMAKDSADAAHGHTH